MLEKSLLVSVFILLKKAQLIHDASFSPISINAQFTEICRKKKCSSNWITFVKKKFHLYVIFFITKTIENTSLDLDMYTQGYVLLL